MQGDFAGAFCRECASGLIPDCAETFYASVGAPPDVAPAARLAVGLDDAHVVTILQCLRGPPSLCIRGFLACARSVLEIEAPAVADCVIRGLADGEDAVGPCRADVADGGVPPSDGADAGPAEADGSATLCRLDVECGDDSFCSEGLCF